MEEKSNTKEKRSNFLLAIEISAFLVFLLYLVLNKFLF